MILASPMTRQSYSDRLTIGDGIVCQLADQNVEQTQYKEYIFANQARPFQLQNKYFLENYFKENSLGLGKRITGSFLNLSIKTIH